MRIYQPFAKYFDELRYDGVYLASALAYAEDERGGSLAAIAGTRIRDLRDFRMRTVGELSDEIAKVRQNFSPERWDAFKRDISFFRAAMGPDFLTTPGRPRRQRAAGLGLVARLFLGHVTASETSLTLAGLIDGAAVPADGVGDRAILRSLADAGRDDRVRRDRALHVRDQLGGGDAAPRLAGAAGLRRVRACGDSAGRSRARCSAFGTMLRVLPAVGLLGVAAPGGRPGSPGQLVAAAPADAAGEFLAQHRAAVRVLVAAAATTLATFLSRARSTAFSAWSEWWVRITLYNQDLAVNEVNLRMLLAGVDAPGG